MHGLSVSRDATCWSRWCVCARAYVYVSLSLCFDEDAWVAERVLVSVCVMSLSVYAGALFFFFYSALSPLLRLLPLLRVCSVSSLPFSHCRRVRHALDVWLQEGGQRAAVCHACSRFDTTHIHTATHLVRQRRNWGEVRGHRCFVSSWCVFILNRGSCCRKKNYPVKGRQGAHKGNGDGLVLCLYAICGSLSCVRVSLRR